MEECPKEKCFNWVDPKGVLFVNESGGTKFKSIEDALKGKTIKFPNGGCSWLCCRKNPEYPTDYFEPM